MNWAAIALSITSIAINLRTFARLRRIRRMAVSGIPYQSAAGKDTLLEVSGNSWQ